MRSRPTRLICIAAVAAAACLPASSAFATEGGGATAPVATDGGGGAYGAPAPQLSAEERAAKRAARRRAAKRAARRRAAKRAARRQAKRRPADRAARRRAARRRARRRAERRDGGTRPRPPTSAPSPAPAPVLSEDGHVFPVAGAYSLGGAGSVFGAPRSGHRHQGHDISAALGTPVVAPYAGTVDWVRYQRGGAGHYVVLDGDGEDRDYVFMHLRRGSIPVVEGQTVAAGEQIGQVGNSGSSTGAHLHFEIWVGGWYERGGEPIDPLPLLLEWAER